MFAALLLHPLVSAAPVDPARPPSSDGSSFAGALAAAASAGGEPVESPVAYHTPTGASETLYAAAAPGLVTASAGKGLVKPARGPAGDNAPLEDELALSGGVIAAGHLAVAVVEAAVPSASVRADLELQAGSASPAPAGTAVVDAGGKSAETRVVHAQLAAAGAAPAPKPAARRADAPAAGDASRLTKVSVPGASADSADLASGFEAAGPLSATGGTTAPNNQTSAAASLSPASAGAAGAPGTATKAAPATAEAMQAAVLADMDAERALHGAQTDLSADEAPRPPEAPLPAAASIVLQPMVNDGRFNAVAQISAQILRRLEGQTTRPVAYHTPTGASETLYAAAAPGLVTASAGKGLVKPARGPAGDNAPLEDELALSGGVIAAGHLAVAVVEAAVPSASVRADLELQAGSASPAPAGTAVVDAGGKSAETRVVHAQLAAAGAAPAPKPAARRADAPAAGDASRLTKVSVPGASADSADLASGFEAAGPLSATGGTTAPNNQTSAAASLSPASAGAAGAPGTATKAAPATAEAMQAAVLADMDAERALHGAQTDLSADEAPRPPEAPLPAAASIVLQPMVNDGRFNAVAQISAQILRRLEGQTTRFELALTPEDLGRVDVMLEIDGDGGVTARLAFDNPAAAAELRAQADQLRRELEAAGLNVARDGLQFAERDTRRDDGGSDRRGAKAFAGAARLEIEADADVAAYRVSPADGRLDVRI